MLTSRSTASHGPDPQFICGKHIYNLSTLASKQDVQNSSFAFFFFEVKLIVDLSSQMSTNLKWYKERKPSPIGM